MNKILAFKDFVQAEYNLLMQFADFKAAGIANFTEFQQLELSVEEIKSLIKFLESLSVTQSKQSELIQAMLAKLTALVGSGGIVGVVEGPNLTVEGFYKGNTYAAILESLGHKTTQSKSKTTKKRKTRTIDVPADPVKDYEQTETSEQEAQAEQDYDGLKRRR